MLYYKRRLIRLENDDQVPEIPISHYLVEKTIATQYAQQRRWASAAVYHEQRAEGLLVQAIGEEKAQGHQIEQGIPRGRRDQHRILVVRN